MAGSTPIRVLQVVPSLSCAAGVANFVYNMECYHDENRVHYDFLHHAISDGRYFHSKRYDAELEAHGSTVYTVNYAGDGLLRFTREVHALFEEIGASYDVVHCHMPNSAFAVLREAKNHSVEHRILHSHLNNSSDVFLHRLRNIPLNAWGKRYATDNIACSQEAGHFLFGTKPFTVINNGIPLDKYLYNNTDRQALRAEIGVAPEDIVIGSVGRFVKQKNYGFAIQVFAEFHRLHPHSKLLILGDGEERTALEALCEEKGLSKSVILPGVRNDINRFYSVMDVFLMPSLYEGLPVSAVEAQAAGLPCVYSRNVPRETDITRTGSFVSLEVPIETWVKQLEQCEIQRRNENVALLEERGYSAKANAEWLMRHYEHLTGRA